MVKTLTGKGKELIHQSVLKAERETAAEIAVVVAPASDEYRAIVLAAGLLLGSVVALSLWHERVLTAFPQLLIVQLAFAALFQLVPPLRHLCVRLAPAHLLRRRAAQHAAAEYLNAAHRLPASAALILLYISRAERYVHIYSSRSVREKIPDDQWNAVVGTLTVAVRSDGLERAVVKAVAHAAEMLKAPFPAVKK